MLMNSGGAAALHRRLQSAEGPPVVLVSDYGDYRHWLSPGMRRLELRRHPMGYRVLLGK